MNGSMEPFAEKSSMQSGLFPSTKPEPSSENGSNNINKYVSIRPLACARQFPKLYQKMVHNNGALQIRNTAIASAFACFLFTDKTNFHQYRAGFFNNSEFSYSLTSNQR